MTSDLSPSLNVSEIVAKGHKRAALIHRAFVSRDLNVLLHAFLANVNSRSRSLYAIARPSVCLSSVVCLSVVCL